MLNFLIIISFANCTVQNENEKKPKRMQVVSPIKSDSLRILLKQINSLHSAPSIMYSNLLEKFLGYENKFNSDFLQKEGDNELFYNKIDIIYSQSKSDIIAMNFIIDLSLITKRNAEFSGYLIKLIPKMAHDNTYNLVHIYKDANNKKKKFIISSLEYFNGPDEYKLFNKNLENIDDDLKESANEVKIKLREYIYNK